MEKTFQPEAIEQALYQEWEEKGWFKPAGEGDSFCIMIPPPNVTGSLHMGHAFQDSIMDALTRYQRMRGRNTLWQVGTDHAGIATQMVVERKLAAEGQPTRRELGRENFLDKVWEWKAESGGTITRQLRRLGASVDWEHERFTMDEGFYKAVQEVFVRLYDEKLIYRGKRLVNWDPKLHTAISDLEVENVEEQGQLWSLRYPLADGETTADGKTYLVVATTRPETMLGDTAVAVNPADERYQQLIGKFIELPLVGRRIPIVADDHVDRDFGSGCVKTTPAHDFNDYAIGQRHQLPMINVLTEDAAIRQEAEVFDAQGQPLSELSPELPEAYRGLDRYAAREAIIADFEKLGLLEKIEPHTLKVPKGDRSGLVIEPLLTDQWFVDAKTLSKPAVEAVQDGRIQFVPKQYENMYFSWMNDIQDWCISRQLWWGHRIPAWYDAEGNIYVARNEAEARSKYQLDDKLELTQDEDVLDTWFSSGLWTFGALGWPENTERLKQFHPTDVLVTGFDIIFFWVARMIMMTMHFMKNDDGSPQVPFKTVYVTGLIRDENGQKMSKSKGNVLDPLDMIDGIELEPLVEKRTANMMQEKKAAQIAKRTRKAFPEGIGAHGTDALRFTLYSLASTGRDINWDMSRLEGYRNFCNKLWNAARYVLMNCEGEDCGIDNDEVELSLADRWIIGRLQQAEAEVEKAMSQYRFDLASQAIYEFTWNEYCDWYLELSKPVLWDDNASAAAKRGTRRTLIRVLETTLRLAHPFMPFITESIWRQAAPIAGVQGESIMLAAYPRAQAEKIDATAMADAEWLKKVITALRNIRGELNVGPNKMINALFKGGNHKTRFEKNRQFLLKLAKLEDLQYLDEDAEVPPCSAQLIDDMEVLVPMAGLIDVDAEHRRLHKEKQRIDKEISRLEGKLNNSGFTAKAPANVIAKEQEKLTSAKEQLAHINKQIHALAAMS